MLLDFLPLEIQTSDSLIDFQFEGDEVWPKWDRFLWVKNKKAFHIGNRCSTCIFFFKRIMTEPQSNLVSTAVTAFNEGLTSLQDSTIQTLIPLFPKGSYQVVLLDVIPQLCFPRKPGDYFSEEQVSVWGVDPSQKAPYSPQTEYYRSTPNPSWEENTLFQFLVPLVPKTWLDKERVEQYKTAINQGIKPTALAIGVLDIKVYEDYVNGIPGPDYATHWCLSHYLMDGHHKMYAAALLQKPITLMSFIALEQGVSESTDIETILRVLSPSLPN